MKAKAVSYLKKGGLNPCALPRGFDFEKNIGNAFELMLPDRFICYDQKCILELDSYISVFCMHLQLTGELNRFSDISASENKSGTIKLSFKFDSKEYSFSFRPESDRWVDQKFYDCLNRFTRKAFKSEFLDFNGDLYSAVYIPSKIANKLNKYVFLSTATTDEISKEISKRKSLREIDWHRIPETVRNGYDNEGETLATRCIIENIEGGSEFILEIAHVDNSLPNIRGVTPYLLAKELGRKSEIAYFESVMYVGMDGHEFQEISSKSDSYSLEAIIAPYIKDLYIFAIFYCGDFFVSREKRFLRDEGTLIISCDHEYSTEGGKEVRKEIYDRYHVENNTLGDNSKRFKKICTKSELVDTLQKYVRGEI